MSQSYNVYFCGELLDGENADEVRPRLAKLFGASEATLDKLFGGSAQLIKRDCDKLTALKYKQAMEQAGARPRIRRSEDGPPADPAPAAPSMAERVAAIAAQEARQAPRAEPDDDGPFSLAPPGAQLLLDSERTPEEVRHVDTSRLALDEPGPLPLLPAEPAPPAPSVTHLSLEETGELIPNLPSDLPPLSPDISELELCADGYDLSDCAPPPAQAPAVDLSQMQLSPEGSPVLEERYRRRVDAVAPSTDHISLEAPPAD